MLDPKQTKMHGSLKLGVSLALLVGASSAFAQETSPDASTLVLAPPPPGYTAAASEALPIPAGTTWSLGEPIPPGYHTERHPKTGLMIGGAILFGMAYVPAIVATPFAVSIACNGGDGPNRPGCNPNTALALLIPGVGPLFGVRGSAFADVLAIADSAAQVAGITMLIVGATVHTTSLVRDSPASSGLHLSIQPILGRNQSGMGVLGTF